MTLEKVKLGAVAKVLNGYAFKSEEYVDSGIRVIRITNVQKGRIQDDDPKFIDIHRSDEFARFMLADSDILISLTGNVGRVGVIEESILPAALNQRVGALKIESENVDPEYLFHVLNSDNFEQDAIKNSKGIAQLNLSSKWVEKYEIPLPPLFEQKRIAGILDAADALRAKRREALARLDTLLQSTFLHLFGDPRNKGSKGQITTRPIKMGVLTKIRTGKLDANAADENGAYPFFTCAVNPLRINATAFDAKAVLVAGNGDLNVKYYEGKFNAYQRTYVIESKDETILAPRFLHIFLDLYVNELRKKAIGGVIKYIKLPYLTQAIIELPAINEQHRFAAIVESVERQKTHMRAHLAELDALFASLQSRAFSGTL